MNAARFSIPIVFSMRVDLGDRLREAVAAEGLVLAPLEVFTEGVVLGAADDFVEGREEHRVLTRRVGLVHPDESASAVLSKRRCRGSF